MTTDEKLLEYFEDDPDCGIDAASDKGYWLEKTTREHSDYLISWAEEAGLSPELLSQLAPIPLEKYLLIKKGKRTMTNGDAWRIDAAIIHYRLSKETWLQGSWKRGRLNKLRMIWKSNSWGPIILVAAILIYRYAVLTVPSSIAYDIGFFIGSALSW
jgi:hypothetical protein